MEAVDKDKGEIRLKRSSRKAVDTELVRFVYLSISKKEVPFERAALARREVWKKGKQIDSKYYHVRKKKKSCYEGQREIIPFE